MVGGAIDPKRVVMKNVDPTPEVKALFPSQDTSFHNLLRDRAAVDYSNMGKTLQPMADALLDYRPRNQISFNQYLNHFQKFPESELLGRVEKLYSGKGSSQDHPKLHQLFVDSFSHHPELVAMYNRH